MTYGSVCSGIESASVAWEPLGWTPAWFSEIEPFPSAVLAHHWPSVANLGDMCKLPQMLDLGLIEAPEVLVGGTPCQAFSVAGMRAGLADERGQLTIKYVEVANAIDRQRPEGQECIAVWENVPGVLSDKSNAFGCFLAALVGEESALEPSGSRPHEGKSDAFWRWDKKLKRHNAKWSNAGVVYGPQRVAAWRILDAQYFGVAQRRRRVFVVASARNGFDPAEVLFEREGMRRDIAPSREEGEGLTHDVAPSLRGDGPGVSRVGDSRGQDPVVAMAHGQGGAEINTTGKSRNHEAPIVCHGTQDPLVLEDKAFPIGRNGGRENVVAFQQNASGELRTGEQAYTLNTNSNASGRNTGMVHAGTTVRRLTPRECERLQGFPDDHTLIDWRNRASRRKIEADVYKYFLRSGYSHEEAEAAARHPDGPRYKAIGNSKARPVIRWVGERIIKEITRCADE